MKQCHLKASPIVYYVSRKQENAEWILFIHAAFVNHNMFQAQIDYFQDKYNILTPDIIGHGASCQTKKKDRITHMAMWMNEILKSENIEKIHVVGISLGAVLAQDFANRYPNAVQSLACFGGYDINNFDTEMQKENSAAQMLMMIKALFSIKWFAKSNMKISAYTRQAQEAFYAMNIQFPKKSFKYLASLNKMINVYQTKSRDYPLLIGCGKHDIPAELTAVEMWKQSEPECQVIVFENAGHCVNMDTPDCFQTALEAFWTMKNTNISDLKASQQAEIIKHIQ